MAGLHFDITGDNSNFMRKLDEARNGVRTTSKQIEESGVSVEQMFRRMTTAVAAFGAGFTAQQFVSQVTKVRGEFQQLEVAFNTMLGSKEKADVLMSQLVKTAAITPFDLQGVANGAKQLLAYGTAAEDVNGTLVRLGDIAAGLSIPLNDIVYLYGTTMTQGRLFTQDLRQFQGRGIPLADELAKQFGVAKDNVGELVTAGRVGFPEVQKAIESMTNEGGRFGGLMEAQSKTISGQISNIEDAIATAFNKIGKDNESIINSVLSGTAYLVEHWEDVAIAIGSAAIAYGTYKAAAMTVAAVQGAEATLKIDAEIEGLQSLLVVKEKSKNADLEAAVASGTLTETKAMQLTSLREELATRLSILKLKEEEAIAEQASALSAFNAAKQTSDAANDRLEKMNALYEAALMQGDASYEQYAMEQLQTASANANTSSTALNTAEKNLNAASSKRKAASEAVDTMATQANTVANHVNTASMNIMKLAGIQLTTMLKGMWATLMANPLMLVAGAVVGLGYALYKVVTAETEAETATRMYSEALDEQKKKQEEYKEKIDSLIKAIDDNNKSEGERLQAFEALKAEYPTVLSDLLTEAEYLKEIAKYKKLIAEEDNNRSRQSDVEILEEAKRKLKYYQDARKNGTSTTLVDMDGNGWSSDNVEDAIKAQLEIVKKATAKVASHDATAFLGNIKDMEDDDIISVIDGINNALKSLGKSGDDAIAIVSELGGEFSKSQLSSIKNALETEHKSRSGDKKTGEEWLASYKKTYEDAEKAYNDFLNSKQVMLEAERDKELARLKELRDAAKTTYESKGGSVSSNNKLDKQQESTAEKLRKQQENLKSLQEKQAIERKRQDEDLEYQAAQARIDAMTEGSEKVQAQMRLDHQKEIQEIQRQKKEYIRARIEQEKKVFDEQEELKARQNKDYKKKTFDASTVTVDTSIFDEITKTTIERQGNDLAEYYKKVLSQYQDYATKRLEAKKKFDADLKKLEESGGTEAQKAELEYQREETYKAIDSEFAMREDSFKAWADNIADLSLEKLRELLVQAERELEQSEFLNPNDPKLAGQRAKVTSLKNTIGEKSEKTSTSPNERSQKEWQDLYKTLSKVERQFDEIGNTVGGTVGEIISAAGGITSSTLQMVDGIITLSDSASTATLSTATAAEKAIKMVENASVILAIIGAALQIATKLASLFGNSSMEYYESLKDELGAINEIYGDIIEKSKEKIVFGGGFAALESYREANDLLERQIENYRKLAEAGGDARKTGSHSYAYRANERLSGRSASGKSGVEAGKGRFEDISEVLGKNIKKVQDLYNLTGEELYLVQTKFPEAWSKIPEEITDSLQAIIDCREESEKLRDALNEAITGVSFDSFYNEFIDMLSDMDTSAEDMAENFGEYLRKSILAAMVAKNFQEDINKLYDKWVAAGEEDSLGGMTITEDEARDIQDGYKKLVDAMVQARDNMSQAFGWDSSATSQDSSSRGFQTMSQDTGEELNGRFTALQIAGEEIKNAMISMLVSVNLISVSLNNNSITLIEIKNLMITSNGYLEDIAGYTKKILDGFSIKLDSINKNIEKAI